MVFQLILRVREVETGREKQKKSCIIDVDVNHNNLATVAFQVVYEIAQKKLFDL